jgi:hypothetical protein
MSRLTPVLDNLTCGPHDLGHNKNEQQSIRTEDDGRIERSEEARAGNASGQRGIANACRPEFDQPVTLVTWRFRFSGCEDCDCGRQHNLHDYQRNDRA